MSSGPGREGVRLLRERGARLVLLDLMLPDANGFSVCEEIRSTHPLVPIIMLTARSQETDKIRGLDVGRRRLRHQAVLGRRAGGAHQRDLPAPAPRRVRPQRAHRDRRRGRRSAQARADAQGEDPRAVVLRGRAAAAAVRARRAAGHARGDPREDLGHARPRRAPAPSTTSWSSCARSSRRTPPSRATSSRSTAPATSWWCDARIAGSAGAAPAATRDVSSGSPAAGRAAGRLRPLPVLRRALPVLRLRGRHARRHAARRVRRRGGRRDRGAPRAGTTGAGPLVSIYFGGGTPGLWRADALGARDRRGARGVRRRRRESELEITVEVNPGEIDEAHLRRCARAASTGCRSACRRSTIGCCAALGPQPRRRGGARLRARGARGGVRQPVDRSDVRRPRAVARRLAARGRHRRSALAPEHVSAYALTVERGTAFGAAARAGRLARPDDDAVAAMFEHARAAFAAAGLARYEVSSYARPGRQSRHNRLYWSLAPYLGAGASASSFRPLADGTAWRFANPRATDVYLREPRTPPPRRAAHGGRSGERSRLARATHRRRDRPRRPSRPSWRRSRRSVATSRSAAPSPPAGSSSTKSRVQLTPAGVLFADEVADATVEVGG